MGLAAFALGVAANIWGDSSGTAGPVGPSLLSKDAFDTTPIAMWPQWQSRTFLDDFAGTVGFGSFDAYLDTTADVLGDLKEGADSYNPGLFPIAGTAALFFDGQSQLVRGVRDEQRAARRGDFAGMYSARGDQAIGVGKSLVAISTIVLPIGELSAVPALTRGPASGARIVSPPNRGQVIAGSVERPVFEGHGSTGPGTFTVPEGTWVQVPNATFVKEEAAQAVAMNGSYPAGQARVYGPGEALPNLVLHPPDARMSVRFSSWQVKRPTLLKDMLDTNMGFCVWAACR